MTESGGGSFIVSKNGESERKRDADGDLRWSVGSCCR